MRLLVAIAVVIGATLVTAVAGCVGGFKDYDQRGGPAIADRIRAANSPLVESVTYVPGDFMDAATIDIRLGSGVSPAEAKALICEVARPAVEAGDPPEGLGVSAWDQGLTRIVAHDLDPCPAS